MTELGDIIMEGLHEIKRLQAGEETGARRHKMTNDKQIEAVARAIFEEDDRILMPPEKQTKWTDATENEKADYRLLAKAAIAAMQEQLDAERMELANRENAIFTAGQNFQREHGHDNVVPMLVEALRFLLEANKDWAKTYELAWPNNAIHLAEQALANLPEELRG